MADAFYDFNTPHCRLLMDHDDDDDELDAYFATPGKTPIKPKLRESTSDHKQATPSRAPIKPEVKVETVTKQEKLKETPKTIIKSLRMDTPNKGLAQEFPVRHSPRLAAIAKEIRRSNASRGYIQSTGKETRNHRRSFSDGTIIDNNFTKVKKQTTLKNLSSKGPHYGTSLTDEDMDTLKELTNLNTKGPGMNKLKTTLPKEFNFATNARLRNNKNAYKDEEVAQEFIQSLRTNKANAKTKGLPRGPTKVQPFNLHMSEKSEPPRVEQFVSMAELNMKFHTKTPQRFRTLSSQCKGNPSIKKAIDSKLTVPNSPHLSSRTRSRAVLYPTREEEEEMEAEEASKHQFKAQPVDKRIYEGPNVSVSGRKTLNIKSNLRKMDSTSSLASTIVPHGGVSSKWEKKSTEVKPFSFDVRDSETLRKKKEKIQKLIEEEKKKAEFHAQAMPIFDGQTKGLPPKKPPTPTKLQPFNLETDQRGSARQQTLQKELDELEVMENERRIFHAQSDAILFKKPFIPEKSKKPLTDISGFSLNTEKRSEERHEFDIHLKQKEDELQALKREREERRLQEEEDEVKKMRKEAVHKAQPIRKYKPVVVQKAEHASTVPISPVFHTKERGMARAASKQVLDDSSMDYTMNSDATYTAD